MISNEHGKTLHWLEDSCKEFESNLEFQPKQDKALMMLVGYLLLSRLDNPLEYLVTVGLPLT